MSLQDWLSSPLLVTIVGALLAGVLIPPFTQRWQNHQKEIELKTSLVSRMTEVVAEPIAFALLASRGIVVQAADNPESLQAQYNEALRKLDTRRAVIESELRAYFRQGRDIGAEWRAFSRAVNYFARLSADDPGVRKSAHVAQVQSYVERLGTIVDWDSIAKATWDGGYGEAFEQTYDYLGSWMLERGGEIMRHVLDAHISGLSA